jgi:hypothetical protein
MKLRHVAAALTVPLAVGTLASPALASSGSRVIQVDVVTTSFTPTSNGFIVTDNDYRESGKKFGSDVLSCHFISKSTVSCDVALATSGGILLARFTQTATSKRFSGPILGGTGSWAGATGQVRGHDTSTGADVEIVLTS